MVPIQLKVGLRYAAITSGALFVMMPGELLMLKWFVDSLDFQFKV